MLRSCARPVMDWIKPFIATSPAPGWIYQLIHGHHSSSQTLTSSIFTLLFFWNVHVPCIIYLYNTFSGSPIIEVTSNPGKEMPQTCWTRAELGRSTERTWEPLWDNQQLTAKGFFIVSNPRMCELAQPPAGAAGDRDKPPWGKHELKSSNLKCQSCKNGI